MSRRHTPPLFLGLWLLLAAANPATAQSRWEVEFYGGAAIARVPQGGTTTLPEPGAPLATTSPLAPTRQVPSWFFGDGASLLNAVAEQFDVPGRIAPLDDLFSSFGRDGGAGDVFGARVRRDLSPRFALEFGVDVMRSAARLGDSARSSAETTRASFDDLFSSLFTTGPFTDVVVDASVDERGGGGRDVAATAALSWRFAPRGAFTPYATLGGGVVVGAGGRPAIGIDGRYAFTVFGVPFDESDRVAVRVEQGTAPVAIAGGGIRREMNDRWSLSVDARVLIGRNGTRVKVDADPVNVTGTPADVIETFSNPGIQLSNNPSTGRQSTLSPPGLDGFDVFRGSGVQSRVLITVGVVRRW
jgi:hypothetical protein